MLLDEFVRGLKNDKRSGNGYQACCPAHESANKNSLSIHTGDDGRILLKCFAGCSAEQIVSAMGLEMKDLFLFSHREPTAHLHTSRKPIENNRKKGVQGGVQEKGVCTPGLTLADYAKAKALPEPFLQSLGLGNYKYPLDTNTRIPAVRIPYYDRDGTETAVRFRIAQTGDKFRWRKRDKTCLYGLSRLKGLSGHILLVEGESDCHTCWYHNLPTVGLPGADNWNEKRNPQHLEAFQKIYIIREPDTGGEAVEKWLSKSSIRNRTYLIALGEHKDPSSLYLADPKSFMDRMQKAMASAVPWAEIERQRRQEELEASLKECKDLASQPSILDEFEQSLPLCGLAGETRAAKILFLCLVSRLFDRPTSVVIDGPSSGGKSFLLETVLKFFPKSAYFDLSAMSDRALAYTEEDLKHRFIVLYEMAGMSGETGTYLIRTLLSENRIRYLLTDKTPEGLQSRFLEHEGPTGLIMTTTATWLHPENATRLIVVTVNDSRQQTADVLLSLAEENKEDVDLQPWHALQEYLQRKPANVIIPYSKELARRTKPLAVRLRRDFAALLSLIRSHTLLHQATRQLDSEGRIIATLDDYRAVLNLVHELIANGIDAAVPMSVKQTVEAVKNLIDIDEGKKQHATVKDVAARLGIDRSAATRRIKTAIRRGYLVNTEEKKGKTMKIVMGESLPADTNIFPAVEELEGCAGVQAVQSVKKNCTPIKDEGNQEYTEGVCRCAGGMPEEEQEQMFEVGVLCIAP